MGMRRATVGEVGREVARIGGRLGAEQIFQTGKKSPRFGFTGCALSNVEARPQQCPDLTRLRRRPFVMYPGNRPIRFHNDAKFCVPFDAVRVAPGLNKLRGAVLSRCVVQPRLSGTDFPSLLTGFGVCNDAKQRAPNGDLCPAAGLTGEYFGKGETVRLMNEPHGEPLVADRHVAIGVVLGKDTQFGIQSPDGFPLDQLRFA